MPTPETEVYLDLLRKELYDADVDRGALIQMSVEHQCLAEDYHALFELGVKYHCLANDYRRHYKLAVERGNVDQATPDIWRRRCVYALVVGVAVGYVFGNHV